MGVQGSKCCDTLTSEVTNIPDKRTPGVAQPLVSSAGVLAKIRDIYWDQISKCQKPGRVNLEEFIIGRNVLGELGEKLGLVVSIPVLWPG